MWQTIYVLKQMLTAISKTSLSSFVTKAVQQFYNLHYFPLHEPLADTFVTFSRSPCILWQTFVQLCGYNTFNSCYN